MRPENAPDWMDLILLKLKLLMIYMKYISNTLETTMNWKVLSVM